MNFYCHRQEATITSRYIHTLTTLEKYYNIIIINIISIIISIFISIILFEDEFEFTQNRSIILYYKQQQQPLEVSSMSKLLSSLSLPLSCYYHKPSITGNQTKSNLA